MGGSGIRSLLHVQRVRLSVPAPAAMSYVVLLNHIVKLARGNSQPAGSVFLHPSAEIEGFQEQVFFACLEVFQRL